MSKAAFHSSSLSQHQRDKIDKTVDAIVSSGVLGSSKRRAALLRYLVDRELDGRGDEIKAFSIALDVMGRDKSFDPNSDSIVRSEVGRLRDALRMFAAELVTHDQVVIEIPKGTYRPSFFEVPLASKPAQVFNKSTNLLAVLLVVFSLSFVAWLFATDHLPSTNKAHKTNASNLPFEVARVAVAQPQVSGIDLNTERLSKGLQTELMMDLSAYPWLSVVAPIKGMERLEESDVDYVLNGALYWGGSDWQVDTTLVEFPDEDLVWADTRNIAADTSVIRETLAEFGSSIASEIGSGQGIAPELTRKENANAVPESMDAFLCYLGIHQYIATPTDATHLELRECLLKAVETFPEFGDGWAALALIYFDEARFARNSRLRAEPWNDARLALAQARTYSPLRMPTLNLALIYAIEGPERDMQEFERVSGLLLDLFPRHPPTLYNVGSRMAEFAGKWDEGMSLVEEAIELNPDPPNSFFLTAAYRTAMIGSDAEALESVQPLTATTAESQLILKYLAASRNLDYDEMAKNRKLLSMQGLSQNNEILLHVKNRRYTSELEATILRQLERAFQLEASR